MKMLILCPLCICLAGCTSQRIGTVAPPPPPVPPVPRDAADSIRYPETLRAYHMGRHVDPSNPLMMHENHTFYRVEVTSRWNLRPGPPTEALAAKLESLPDPAHTPAPVNDEITAELNHQKEMTRKVTTEASRLTETLEQLSAALADARTQARQNVALKEKLSQMEQRLVALENELRQSQKPPESGATNAISDTDH